jgi:ribosomal protein L27
MTISKGSMTPTRDTRASRSSSRVPSLHQVINDHIITFKGTRTIKPSNVGPRTSSGLLHQARGFIGFFNHLNHTRRPPRVKIHHDITCGVARPSPGVP